MSNRIMSQSCVDINGNLHLEFAILKGSRDVFDPDYRKYVTYVDWDAQSSILSFEISHDPTGMIATINSKGRFRLNKDFTRDVMGFSLVNKIPAHDATMDSWEDTYFNIYLDIPEFLNYVKVKPALCPILDKPENEIPPHSVLRRDFNKNVASQIMYERAEAMKELRSLVDSKIGKAQCQLR